MTQQNKKRARPDSANALSQAKRIKLPQRQVFADYVNRIFSDPYAKTFKRKSFTKVHRLEAWQEHAEAECMMLGQDFAQDLAINGITEMGLTVRGMNLRHIIPYSDIAIIFQIANSDTALHINEKVVRALRVQISQLLRILGLSSQDRILRYIYGRRYRAQNINGLLLNYHTRRSILLIYDRIVRGRENLFQGDGPSNIALGNRPDVPINIPRHKRAIALRLLHWWYETMGLLGVKPKYRRKTIADFSYDNNQQRSQHIIGIHEHQYSRTLRLTRGDWAEIDMMPYP